MNRSLVLGLALGLLSCPLAAQPPHHAAGPAAGAAAPAPKLQAALRGLWQGHVTHTRAYAFAVQAGDASAAKAAEAAVVRNAREISRAVAGFYGEAAGSRMLELLSGHWLAVKGVTDAARRGDSAAHAKATAELGTNARAIARFLAATNPHLPEDAVHGLLAAHGGHHVAQVAQIMKGDRSGEAATWVAMRRHMDTIADALAKAIAAQFPGKAA